MDLDRQVMALCRRLGHDFSDLTLVRQALTHRSHGNLHNERLEFLGDSIVNFVVAEALFQRFPLAREGDMSRMRARLVKGETLAEIAREFGFGECLRLGPGELKSGGHRRDSILADALEAVIGALYLDAGMTVCRERLLMWYSHRLDAVAPGEANKDFKTRLQELLQSRRQQLPRYGLVETVGDAHNQSFTVQCVIPASGRSFTGSGSNRRGAEQAAAEAALIHLESE